MTPILFFAGLPHSGAEIISDILSQNSEICTEKNSRVFECIRAIAQIFVQKDRTSESKKTSIIRGIFHSVYDSDRCRVGIDVNYEWTLILPLLNELIPESKVIVFVRDIPTILNEMELLIRTHPYSMLVEQTNVYNRCERWMNPKGLVGSAYEAVKQAVAGSEKQKMMFVEYSQVRAYPSELIESIFEFAGIYSDFPYDTRSVKNFQEPELIIPPDIVAEYSGLEIWRTTK